MNNQALFDNLGIGAHLSKATGQRDLIVHSPIDGSVLGTLQTHTPQDMEKAIAKAQDAFLKWRLVPAPKRGELIGLYGDLLQKHKEDLGKLVTLEAGKILEEGKGEVQEMIDICYFAHGLSRQLYGLTIASERPQHRMMETWHPLGVVGAITPFNFPVAVWCWNFALSTVCGNTMVWKPSPKTPLTALACYTLFQKALQTFDSKASPDLLQLQIGDKDIVETLVDHPKVPLVSVTGSSKLGAILGPRITKRFGRPLLELGGNNAMILCPSADLELAIRAIAFSSLGTAGQRCTSLRRLLVHRSIHDQVIERLKSVFSHVSIGNPLETGNLMGPLIDEAAYLKMEETLAQAQSQGGEVIGGGRTLKDQYPQAFYVKPALVLMPKQTPIMQTETFAPILYVLAFDNLAEAITLHNDVPQGLSSCIFTKDIQEAETFLSAAGSDCGIANVNIGPSGAEIGGAFGGEKETGGGRESGSDSWKAYMRRATNTINYGNHLPLAQGIHFEVKS